MQQCILRLPPPQIIPNLRFQGCCQRAYNSAVKLAAWAGGYTEASLKSYYEESTAAGWFDQTFGHVMDFDSHQEEVDDPAEAEARDMSFGQVVKGSSALACLIFFMSIY